MDTRAKDFNKYLGEVQIFDGLTKCFARLFMFTDFDRPDHGIWFLQNCMNEALAPDFIVEYDKCLNELATNTKIIKNDEKQKQLEQMALKDEEERKKLEEEASQAKAKKEQANAAKNQPSKA